MSIIDWIENLRQKPEMTRRRILVGTTFAITAVIFFFWLSVRLYDTGTPTISTASSKRDGPIEETANAVGIFIDSVGKTIDSAKKILSGLTATSTASVNMPDSPSGMIEIK